MTEKVLHKHVDTGLLVLRVGIGIMFLLHGAPKLFGGPSKWTGVGGAMGNLGITFMPAFWGFMAGLAEFGGGLLLILGLFVRPAAAFLIFTMFVAAMNHIAGGDGIMGASQIGRAHV
jgi:putative oxidoreductase